MKIGKIKIKNIDSKFTLKSIRTAEIKTNAGTIETPTRGATLFEYNAKTKVPTNILIGNPIALKYNSVGFKTMNNFLTNNKTFENFHRTQENTNYRIQHTLLKFTVFQPTITANKKQKILPAMDIIQTEKNLKKFLDLIIALQEHLNFDVITLPFLNLPYSILKKTYVDRSNQIRKSGKEPFFVLNLKHKPEDFEKLIKLFVNDLQIQLIGLNFQKFQTAALNYRELSHYYDKDVLFYTIQVSRNDSELNDISASHYMPFLTNDIFSVAAPRNFIPEGRNDAERKKKLLENKTKRFKNHESYLEELLKLRMFNKKNLDLQTVMPMMNNVNELLNDVDNPKDDRLENMLQHFNISIDDARDNEERFSNLKSFTWIHELKSSVSEFTKFRKFVSQSDTESYVDEHDKLKNAVIKQKSIIKN